MQGLNTDAIRGKKYGKGAERKREDVKENGRKMKDKVKRKVKGSNKRK
jgi:hypothetical protein